MDDPALEPAARLIVRFEGFSPRPYLDVAGVWTIGYGATTLEDGSRVTGQTPPITPEQGMFYVRRRLTDTYLAAVRRLGVPLTVNQAAALASLCYNIGPSAFRASDVAEALCNRDYPRAADRMLGWNKARDPETHQLKVSQGLVNRRSAERTMFLRPDAGEGLAQPPHEMTADELNAEVRAGTFRPGSTGPDEAG